MKLRRIALVLAPGLAVLTFLTLAGFAHAADSVAQQQQTVTIQLAVQNNSGESGTATLTDVGNNQTRVVLNLQGAPAGVSQPVHIHEGTCANLNAQPAFPLTNLSNGASETTVPIALSALLGKPYAINAHKSAQEVSVYVSCGNIVATAGPRTGGPTLPWLGLAGLAALTLVGAGYALRRQRA